MGSSVTLSEHSLKHLLETCHNCTKGNLSELWMGNISESVGKEGVCVFSFLCCGSVITSEGVTWQRYDTNPTERQSETPASKPQPGPRMAEEEDLQDPIEPQEQVNEFVDIGIKSEECSRIKNEECVRGLTDDDDSVCKVVLEVEEDPLMLDEVRLPLPNIEDTDESPTEGQTQHGNMKFSNKNLRKNLVRILEHQDSLGVNVVNKNMDFTSQTKGRKKKYPDMFTCEFCGKVFGGKDRAYQFYHHRNREHTQERMYKCVVCSKVFWGDRELMMHQLQHRDQQSHVCHVCGHTFNTKRNLTRHLLLHTSGQEYVCHFCDKTFRRKDHLTVHERIHTGVRPYQCQWCDSAYPQKHQLRQHIKNCPVLKIKKKQSMGLT